MTGDLDLRGNKIISPSEIDMDQNYSRIWIQTYTKIYPL